METFLGAFGVLCSLGGHVKGAIMIQRLFLIDGVCFGFASDDFFFMRSTILQNDDLQAKQASCYVISVMPCSAQAK
jgi:hypothetical protein